MPICASSVVSLLAAAVTILLSSSPSDAFSVTPSTTRLPHLVHHHHTSTTRLSALIPRDEGIYGDDDSADEFDLEAARERLEALVSHNSNNNNDQQLRGESGGEQMTLQRRTPQKSTLEQAPTVDDVVLPPARPLTTMDRERRHVEIELLSQLAHGDDHVADLWTIWFNERGAGAARKLIQAEEWTAEGPHKWQQAEDVLRELMEEHGVYFAEPVNRLATLYYMQGRLEQAETLCKIVLAVKPWHFGALSNIVMVYAAMADSEKARQWAASRLPTFAPTGPNRRRAAWVQKATFSATEALRMAEKRVKDMFGEPDDYSVAPDGKLADGLFDDGDFSWQ